MSKFFVKPDFESGFHTLRFEHVSYKGSQTKHKFQRQRVFLLSNCFLGVTQIYIKSLLTKKLNGGVKESTMSIWA